MTELPVWVELALLLLLDEELPEAVRVAVPSTAVLRWLSVPVPLPVDDSVRL